MRKFEENKSISVHAVAGSYVVMLGMDATAKGVKGLLGFAIHRTDHTEKEAYWLKGFLTFEETDEGRNAGESAHILENPVQDFQWGDYTAKPGHKYTYKIVPVYGKPKNLIEGDVVEVSVKTESDEDGINDIYFNRGVAGSQAYVRKFGNKSPEDVPDRAAYVWLSRGLEEALLAFIGQAKGKGWELRASLYETVYGPALQSFSDAVKRGVDVKIVFDDKRTGKGEMKSTGKANWKAINKNKIKDIVIPRNASGVSISHNKFIVLLKNNKPVAVWTGSTNITTGGIFGHSNVGHAVQDETVAQTYLDYWETISQNPSAKIFRPWNDSHTPVNNPGHKTQMIFSPRGSLEALENYAAIMNKAKSSVFLTAAFGVSTQFAEIFFKEKGYLRYLLLESKGRGRSVDYVNKISENEYNRIALGAIIESNELENWHKENLTNLNVHVRYIHTKYMLVDPLSDRPITITGSANFSEASTKSNDENMLIIRGNKRVADIYIGEYMRLFKHFYFRNKINQAKYKNVSTGDGKPRKKYLKSTDYWTKKYYVKNSVREKERLLFNGKRS